MNESNADFDMNSALEALSQDFGGSSASPPVPPTGSDTAPGGSEPPLEPWAQLPKSWKKELSSHWGPLPPEVKRYIHEREKQALEGILRYKNSYDPYAKLEERLKPLFAQWGGSLPELAERLINTHLTLLYGPAEQKQQLLNTLVRDYNLGALLQGGQPPSNGQANPLQQELSAVRERLEMMERSMLQNAYKAAEEQVQKFLAQPDKEFASEVIKDMTRLLESGLAKDLEDAYQQAIWSNPEVRAKLLEREVSKAAAPKAPPPRNVRASSTQPAQTRPQDEDMDATLARVYKEITSR